jgi:hypothetical protein
MAFADIHGEIYDMWTVGDTVLVRLALQGTHTGPLETPFGTIPQRARGWTRLALTSSSWKMARSRSSAAFRKDQ